MIGKGKSSAQSMAAMFAAKEAFLKAVGTGITIPLTDVEISHTPSGQPVYCLHGKAAELVCGGQVLLSITHEKGMAAAMCVWSI
ncbi:MAG: 4'-phosphopantetheinyl transferase superfamily protein [Clostridia bacterium]|nr:4'-phosphopantetheinyl transferase superfamily protein [Clostridia bacterium]